MSCAAIVLSRVQKKRKKDHNSPSKEGLKPNWKTSHTKKALNPGPKAKRPRVTEHLSDDDEGPVQREGDVFEDGDGDGDGREREELSGSSAGFKVCVQVP